MRFKNARHRKAAFANMRNRTSARGIVKRKNKYLLVRRLDGRYEFPGGKTDGEHPKKALEREMKEETNLNIKDPEHIKTLYSKEGYWTRFYKTKANGKIKLQPEELNEYRYVTTKESKKLRMTRPSRRMLNVLKKEDKNG